ncbi:hypothetical protein AGMMS50262_02670 [Bacteroidia bacterium]|nr:hypothetical protein AGMMS50262_02670 [Bacteroidia bacterium]
MRKLFFLVVLLVSSVFVAKADGPWFTGQNLVYELVSAVTDKDGNALKTVDGYDITPLYKTGVDEEGNPYEPGSRINDSQTDADDNPDDGFGAAFWDYTGVVWVRDISVPWENGNEGKFWGLKSIDWTDFGYIQKADHPIIWQQYDVYDPVIIETGNDKYKNIVQDNDLEFLESLNFSGNKFIHFELDGALFCPVTTINFSNNPTLETLVILNCSELKEVNITNNGFTLAKIYEISQTVETSLLKYAPQGTIAYSFPTDAVDLSADATLDKTATTIVWTGAQPVFEENGVFKFAASDKGKTITAELSNGVVGSESITYTITLTQALNGINTPAAEQKVWTAGKQLFVTSNTAETMHIYTMDGRLVKQQNVGAGTSSVALDNSLYLVRFDNGAVRKVLIK